MNGTKRRNRRIELDRLRRTVSDVRLELRALADIEERFAKEAGRRADEIVRRILS